MLAEEGELAAYRALLGERFRDARNALAERVARQQFFARPPFEWSWEGLASLVEGRRLTRFDVPVPFGRFHAMLAADCVGVDPSYVTVIDGKARLVERARRAAAELVLVACDAFSTAGHPDAKEPLVDALLHCCDVCHRPTSDAPVDLAEAVARSMMLRTTAGTNTSLDAEFADFDELELQRRILSSRMEA